MVGKIKEWNKEIMSKEKLQKLWRTMDGFVSYCRNTNLSFILPYYSREEKLQPCLPLTFEALPSVLEHLCPHFSFLFWQSFPPCDNAWSKRQRRVPQHEEQMARPSRDGFSEGKKTLTLRLTHWDPADPGTQSPSQRDSSVFLSLYTELRLCMYVSKLLAHWYLYWDNISSPGYQTNILAVYGLAYRQSVVSLALMYLTHLLLHLAVILMDWQSCTIDYKPW